MKFNNNFSHHKLLTNLPQFNERLRVPCSELVEEMLVELLDSLME